MSQQWLPIKFLTKSQLFNMAHSVISLPPSDLTTHHSFLKLTTLRSYSLQCPEAFMLLLPLAFTRGSFHLHHGLNGLEFEQTLGGGEGQGNLPVSFAW